jgi:hypothetical protein
MRLLGKQLKVDFLPGCTVEVNILVAKEIRARRALFRRNR